MKTRKFSRFMAMAVALIIASLACGQQVTGVSPSAVPQTESALPTETSIPGSTTAPDVSAAQQQESILADVQKYYEKGYLPSTSGEYYHLDDFTRELAEIHRPSFMLTGHEVKDFMIRADLEWDSAAQFPEEPSGCGFAFRYQDNGDTYIFVLDNHAVWMIAWDASAEKLRRLGITTGTGLVNLERPAKANIKLFVNEIRTFVVVNGLFIGEYSLYTEKILDKGILAYAVVSGTNKDYGTRCTMTNVDLWMVSP